MNLKTNAFALLALSPLCFSAYAAISTKDTSMNNSLLEKRASANKRNRPKVVSKVLRKLSKKKKTSEVSAAPAETPQAVSAVDKSTSNLIAPKLEAIAAPVDNKNKKLLPLTLSTWNNFMGPMFKDPTSMVVGDDSVDAVTGLTLRTQASLRYQLPYGMAITPVLDFDYQFTDPNPEPAQRREFRWRDSFVRFSKSGIYETNLKGNDIALDGDIRYFIPSSKGSRDTDSYGSIRATLSPSIQFAKSKFSLSITNYGRYWLQSRDTHPITGASLKNLEFYTGPQVNYAINDRFTAYVLYEADVVFNKEGQRLDSLNPAISFTDLEPGVEIKLTNRIMISPYANWFLNQRISTATMNLQAVINLY